MSHPLVGQPASAAPLLDLDALRARYHAERPRARDPSQDVEFGPSGHLGSALRGTFDEGHVLSVVQALCDYRAARRISGPLFLGRDTHALSDQAQETALEVLAANGVEVLYAAHDAVTPAPVVSHAILRWNLRRPERLADGLVLASARGAPEDCGLQYDPPGGGPAGPSVAAWLEQRANQLHQEGCAKVRQLPIHRAMQEPGVRAHDFVRPYVEDLRSAIDFEWIRKAGLRLGIDPLCGSTAAYWRPIALEYGLDLTVVEPSVEPTFGALAPDPDGHRRPDCTSPHAMARLVALKDEFDLAFGCDASGHGHGIVTRSEGLLPPGQFLATAADALFRLRGFGPHVAVGKTQDSSALLDQAALRLGRRLHKAPGGFSGFTEGLTKGTLGFCSDEGAGATFLRRDGAVWTTDMDGLLLCLLAAELHARAGPAPRR